VSLDAMAELRRNQIRTLLSVDDMVDRLFRTLHAQGELDDTLIFFISDNGFLWGEHFIDRKFVPYTSSIGVPLLVRWPRRDFDFRSTDTRLAANIDIAPTILDVTNVQPALVAPLDGRSLLSGDERDRVLTEYWQDDDNNERIPSWASLRTREYQYVEYYDALDAITFREYYDLRADPYQLVNLLAVGNETAQARAAAAANQLSMDRRCVGSDCP
jgi:arylsulfatase A-like enzyme